MNEIRVVSKNLVNFVAAKKDDNDAAINNLRLLLTSKKIIIHPKCVTLIQHLKNVKWKKGKKIFARSTDNGHYDAVDALKYLVRTIESSKKNPYPAHYDFNMRDIYIKDKDKFDSRSGSSSIKINKTEEFAGMDMYRRMFGMNRKKR
jgi:hypothetical protein